MRENSLFRRFPVTDSALGSVYSYDWTVDHTNNRFNNFIMLFVYYPKYESSLR